MTDKDAGRKYVVVEITFGALLALGGGVLATFLGIVSLAFWMGSMQNRVEVLEDTDDFDAAVDKAIKFIESSVNERIVDANDMLQEVARQATVYSEQELAASRTNTQFATFGVGGSDEGPRDNSTSELEQKFSNLNALSNTPANHLVVREDQKYIPKAAFESFLTVTLQQNSVLEMPPDFSSWQLITRRLEVGPGARIDGTGSDGDNGVDGSAGNSGSDCVAGTDGTAGHAGGNGGSGTSISLVSMELVVSESLAVNTRGGHGGKGGAGGQGGRGGKADRSKWCVGANGGNGGDGGRAGNGGDGGDLSVSFYKLLSIDNKSIDMSRLGEVINHEDSPGKAGLAGFGGGGGIGGAGRGKDFFGRSLPGGTKGTDGNSGRVGEHGARGAMTIVPFFVAAHTQ